MVDDARRFAGTVTIETEATIADDGQNLDGTFTYAISAANAELSSQGGGTVRGERKSLMVSQDA
jgi:hypothetical protein